MAPEKATRRKTPPKATHTVSMEALNLDLIPVQVLSDEETTEIIRQSIARLMERANLDSIRICATTVKGGETHSYTLGLGNIFAQEGSVHAWLSILEGSDMPASDAGDGE